MCCGGWSLRVWDVRPELGELLIRRSVVTGLLLLLSCAGCVPTPVSPARGDPGWYLAVPWGMATDAPVGKWNLVDTRTQLGDCQAELKEIQDGWRSAVRESPGDELARTALNEWAVAQCVATDDPRLER
jgi:hypothetical protein